MSLYKIHEYIFKNKLLIIIFFIIFFLLFNYRNILKLNNNENNKIYQTNDSIFYIIQENKINLDNIYFKNSTFLNESFISTKNSQNNQFILEKHDINRKNIWKWFFIDNNWTFITNKHIFKNKNSKYSIKIKDKLNDYNFKIIKKFENFDIIIWKINFYKNRNFFNINKNYDLQINDHVYIIKNNNKLIWKIVWLNENIKEFNLTNLIKTNIILYPWDSWSPLFNKYWNVIWVNSAINNIENTSYAINLKKLFIKNN